MWRLENEGNGGVEKGLLHKERRERERLEVTLWRKKKGRKETEEGR